MSRNLRLNLYLKQNRALPYPEVSKKSDVKKLKLQHVFYNKKFNLRFIQPPCAGYIYKGLIYSSGPSKHPEHFFHTSSRRFIPPFLLILAGSIAKVGAVISGGALRILYKRLDKENKAKYIKQFKKYWYLLVGGSFSSLVPGTFYYQYCMEKTPITERKRFMIFTKQQRAAMTKTQSEMLRKHFKLNHEAIYEKTNAKHLRVEEVAEKLIASNKELKKIEKLKVYIIKDSMVNAHILSDGHVFVCDSILKLANTPDQIAILLGHEMAHALLEHGIEKLSHGNISEDIIISVLGIVGFFLPNGEIAKYLRGRIVRMQVQRPYTHEMEDEADVVGMRFAANACYDVREGIVLWRKMEEYQKTSQSSESYADWTWTHPDSLERAAHLEGILDEAQQWRKDKNCPELPENDPRNKKIKLPSKHSWYKNSARQDSTAIAEKETSDSKADSPKE
ncbi:metalloendopeptidase [Bulinus truncatus]|nr:metalloendopeptidase [Bulinus truncatus]